MSKTVKVNILDIKMQENDADAETIGDYLRKLLLTVWQEAECFSGKRPFGNSDWQYELYIAMAKAEIIESKFDEYNELESFDQDLANGIITENIRNLGKS